MHCRRIPTTDRRHRLSGCNRLILLRLIDGGGNLQATLVEAFLRESARGEQFFLHLLNQIAVGTTH